MAGREGLAPSLTDLEFALLTTYNNVLDRSQHTLRAAGNTCKDRICVTLVAESGVAPK